MASRKKARKKEEGGWIVGIGLAIAAITGIYQMLLRFDVVKPIGGFDSPFISLYGYLFAMISVSINS